MSKLLAILAAGLFSATVFAQTAPAAPMAGASDAKAEAKAPAKKATKVAKKTAKKATKKHTAKKAVEPKTDKN
jgi:hypothetical protein